MRRAMDLIYLIHFASILTVLVGGFGLLGEVRGARGFDVNPNFAKRVLSRTRAIRLGMWGLALTGLALLGGGVEIGFMAGRIATRRHLPAGLLPASVLLLVLLIAAALHPMVSLVYRLVPALRAKPGTLDPDEAGALVRRLRRQAAMMVAFILAALAVGVLHWLYAAGIPF